MHPSYWHMYAFGFSSSIHLKISSFLSKKGENRFMIEPFVLPINKVVYVKVYSGICLFSKRTAFYFVNKEALNYGSIWICESVKHRPKRG